MGLDTNRVLRIGVVYKGQILAERVLDKRSDVTVGTRSDSTVQVSAKDYPSFPASEKLAVLHKDTYHLVLPEGPVPQVNLRGGSAGSQGLNKKEIVQVKGRSLYPIEAFTGGSIAFGDIILMFQFVRSDSVPTVTHEETVLRIGLVYESRLLSDRVFPVGETVTVGSTAKDVIVLDSEDYKGGSAVFKIARNGRVKVSLPKSTGLRLATTGAPMDEDEAVSKGVVRRSAEGVELDLELKSRGRASLGPYTLLFQVVRRTMTIPVMQRKTFVGQLLAPLMGDAVWSISLFVSFLLVGSIITQAIIFQVTTGQYLKQQRLEDYEALGTYEVLIEEKEEPKPTVDIKSKKAQEEEKKEVQKEEKKEKKVKKKPESIGKTITPEERKKRAKRAVAKRTIAGAFMQPGGARTKLFAEGGEGEGGEVMARTFGGGEGEDEGGPSTGLKIRNAGEGGTMERVSASKRKGFGGRDKNKTKVKAKKVEKRITIKLSAGGLNGSGSGKAGIARVIARKNSAVRRCYEAALRVNPSLSGKVRVRFTVGTAGTVTSVSVLGASGGFSSCIKSKFSRIRGLPLLPSPQSFTQSYVFTKG